MKKVVVAAVVLLPSLLVLGYCLYGQRAAKEPIIIVPPLGTAKKSPTKDAGEEEIKAFYRERGLKKLFDRGLRHPDWMDGMPGVAENRKLCEKIIHKLRDENYPLERWHCAVEAYIQVIPPSEVPDDIVDNAVDCFRLIVQDYEQPQREDIFPIVFFIDYIGNFGPRAKDAVPTLEKLKRSSNEQYVEKALKALIKIKGTLR